MSARNAPSLPIRRPHLIRALAMLGATGLATPALGQNWSWTTGSGVWSNALNWNPLFVPPDDVNVFIGNLGGAQNATVTVDDPLDLANLVITDGMTLFNNHWSVRVSGHTMLSGSNTLPGPGGTPVVYASRLLLNGVDGTSFMTHDLTMSDGARIDLSGFAIAHASGDVMIGAGTRIHGSGIFTADKAGTALVNNGQIGAAGEAGLSVVNYNGGSFDLDGTTGNGIVRVDGYLTPMRFVAQGLTDNFSGTIQIERGATLTMDLADGWTADANSTIEIMNNNFGDFRSTIDGSDFRFGGHMTLHSSLLLSSHTIEFLPTSRVLVTESVAANIGYSGTTMTTIHDGSAFEMEPGAPIAFNSPVTIHGGDFHGTPNGAGVLPYMRFYEETEWDGTVDFEDVYAQNFGAATVVGPTVINATMIDIAASNFEPLNQVWSINNSLVINTDAFAPYAEGRFDGTMNISGGALGRFTLNLSDPADAWTMDGEMELRGLGALPVTRVAGARMIVTGDLEVSNGVSQSTADLDFRGAGVDIESGSTLRTRGATTIDAETSFSGSGTLQNGLGGVLILHDGVALNDVGLTNTGIFGIGVSGPGIAGVDRFLSTDDAIWAVDIGGAIAATEHDMLSVTGGTAELGGELVVLLADLGAGVFAPSIGDEFVILLSVGGVSGEFTSDPVTVVGALTYGWDVVYNPNSVVLRLESIVPAPGALALLGIAGLTASRRRSDTRS